MRKRRRKENEKECGRNGSANKIGSETREANCYILPPFRPDSVLRGCRLMIEVF